MCLWTALRQSTFILQQKSLVLQVQRKLRRAVKNSMVKNKLKVNTVFIKYIEK